MARPSCARPRRRRAPRHPRLVLGSPFALPRRGGRSCLAGSLSTHTVTMEREWLPEERSGPGGEQGALVGAPA